MTEHSPAKNPVTDWRSVRIIIAWQALAVCAFVFSRECVAQNTAENPGIEYPATGAPTLDESKPEPSREEWHERIRAAKENAKQMARDRRDHPELYDVPEEDPERIATDRILNDQSLQPGDIVSTNKGLFVFRGRSDQAPKNEDFIQLSPR